MRRFGGFRWAVTAVLGAVVLVPSSPSLATPAVNHWAYAVGRKATTSSYQPGAANSRTDTHSTVSIARTSVGHYAVSYPNMAIQNPNFGVFLTSAISGTGGTCGMASTIYFPSSVTTNVACYDRTGNPADSKFSTNFLELQTLTGRAAYLFADQPSTQNYTPEASHQYNSSGGTNAISRTAAGWYDVFLPGMATTGGHAQVTTAIPGGYCEVVALTNFSMIGAEGVRVYCRNAAGAKTDGQFSLVFTDGQGLKFHSSTGVAYLLADRLNSPYYIPVAAKRYETDGGVPHVFRSSAGRYQVQIGSMPAGGAAEVTTYGGTIARCEVSSLPSTGSPVTIGVTCLKPDGTPNDARFGLAYTR